MLFTIFHCHLSLSTSDGLLCAVIQWNPYSRWCALACNRPTVCRPSCPMKKLNHAYLWVLCTVPMQNIGAPVKCYSNNDTERDKRIGHVSDVVPVLCLVLSGKFS